MIRGGRKAFQNFKFLTHPISPCFSHVSDCCALQANTRLARPGHVVPCGMFDIPQSVSRSACHYATISRDIMMPDTRTTQCSTHFQTPNSGHQGLQDGGPLPWDTSTTGQLALVAGTLDYLPICVLNIS